MPYLTSLFNELCSNGYFPEQWCERLLIPIFKGGNHEPKDFRQIKLHNILLKTYAKLLVNRLIKWSEKHETLIDNQYGFQKHKSTTDCIFIFYALISRSLANSQKSYAFLDWEKMFDTLEKTFKQYN